jgi:hypothetical protein
MGAHIGRQLVKRRESGVDRLDQQSCDAKLL